MGATSTQPPPLSPLNVLVRQSGATSTQSAPLPPLKLLVRQARRSASMAALLPLESRGDLPQQRLRRGRREGQGTQPIELVAGQTDVVLALQKHSAERVLHVGEIGFAERAEAE